MRIREKVFFIKSNTLAKLNLLNTGSSVWNTPLNHFENNQVVIGNFKFNWGFDRIVIIDLIFRKKSRTFISRDFKGLCPFIQNFRPNNCQTRYFFFMDFTKRKCDGRMVSVRYAFSAYIAAFLIRFRVWNNVKASVQNPKISFTGCIISGNGYIKIRN